MFEIKKKKERNIDTNDDILCNMNFYLKKNCLASGGIREGKKCLIFFSCV